MFNFHDGVHISTLDACKHPDAAKWQRIAPVQKVEAIKLVRASNGYDLKVARDVVEYWLMHRSQFASETPAPVYPKVWEIETGLNTKHRVTENGDGTYTMEVIVVHHCRDLGDLLRRSMI